MKGFVVEQAEDRVPVRGIAWVAVVSAIVLAGSIAIAAVLGGKERPRAIVPPPLPATGQGIEVRDAQRADLASWGYVDRDAGIARIPISQAMDLWLAREADGGAP